MVFLEALAAAVVFALLCGKALQKRPVPFYLGFTALSVLILTLRLAGVSFGGVFGSYIYPIFDKAALGTALFVLVMYAGAFPNGSAPVKRLMPIRGQLSILASILTLAHNISYGKTYFLRLFGIGTPLAGTQRWAAVCSLCMLLIMLPLFVTSFRCVRRKLPAKRWKKLQRHAYGFYALIWLHVMLLNVPSALRGSTRNLWNAAIYTAVFGAYLCLRVLKAVSKNRKAMNLRRAQCIGAVCMLAVGIAFGAVLNTSAERTAAAEAAAEAEAEAAEAAERQAQALAAAAEESSPNGEEGEASSGGGYRDGTYTASAFGYEGDVTVCVVIEGGEIVSVTISDYADDPDYREQSEAMVGRINADPLGEPDAISGATFTSEAILKAYAKALAKAEN